MKEITREDLKPLNHRQKVVFALFCANQVYDKWKNIPEAVKAIEVTEKWLEGKATAKECKAAANAAYAGYAAAVYAAANAAANAAYATNAAAGATYAVAGAVYAAANAAAYANKQQAIKEQHKYLYELINIDKILEETLLR